MVQQDLELLRDIPGYKAILKALIKSQIQYLVEQLSMHGDEESVLLTASISDGSLSHLGSESGKVFLDNHDDIKSQFLGFCLKREHTKAMSFAESAAASAASKDVYPASLQTSAPLRRRKSATKQHFSPTAAPYTNKDRLNAHTMYPSKSRVITPSFSSPSTDDGASNSVIHGHNMHSAISGGDNVMQQDNQDERAAINSNNAVNTSDTSIRESSILRTSDSNAMEHHVDASHTDNCEGETVRPNIKIEPVSSCDDDIVITGVEGGSSQDSGQGGDPASWLSYTEQQNMNQPYDSAQMEPNLTNIPMPIASSMNAPSLSSGEFPYKFLLDSSIQTGYAQTYSSVGPRLTADVSPMVTGSQQTGSGAIMSSQESFCSNSNDVHIEKLDGGRFKCLLCERVFNRKDYIRKHLLVHFGEKPYKCRLCPATFRQKTHIRLHMNMKHNAGTKFEILME